MQRSPHEALQVALRVGGLRLLRRVASTFEVSARMRLQIMGAALQHTDIDGFRAAAHGLRGSALQVGAVALAATCARAEALADPADIQAAGNLVGAMRSEVDDFLRVLQRFLEGEEGAP